MARYHAERRAEQPERTADGVPFTGPATTAAHEAALEQARHHAGGQA